MTLYVSSLLIACGICLFAGVHAVLAGSAGEREPVNQSFGVLSLLLAAYLLCTASLFQADTLAVARSLTRWQMGLACLIYPAAVWFLGLYTGLRRWRRWLLAAGVVFGVLLLANLFSPNSMIYSDIVRHEPIRLPWGEQVSNFVGTHSTLFGVYFLAKDVVYVWAIGCCVVLWRRRSERAWPLTLFLLIEASAALHADVVNRAGIQTVTWESLAFLALVLVMGDQLRRELQQRGALLEHRLAELRAETVRRERVESDLRHLAYHDPVTSLPNRLALREHVQATLGGEHRGDSALIVLDLDHFRTINEALGHDVGDLLLKAIAARLVAVAPVGALVTHAGGDEFALHVELPFGQPPAAAARDLVRELTARLTAPFLIGAHDLAIGVSGGIALLPGMPATSASPSASRYNASIFRQSPLRR
ncbi:diguanylate cyclase domain-containing protein [Rhodanobacter lindaniclasticus]